MVRSPRVLLGFTFLLISAPLLTTSSARAQYMYMDANGDGIWSTADVLNPNGTPTTVDVWINTNHDRDGSLATCSTNDGNLGTWNSYAVHITALNGTVSYSGFLNDHATFTLGCAGAGGVGFKSNDTEMSACQAGFQSPGGLQKMFTVTVTGITGTPSLEFVPRNSLDLNPTSFGTPCSGLDFDNTYKLGSDWFDADGLEPPGSVAAPSIDPIADVTIDENTTAQRHVAATDPDGDALTLTMPGAPWWASLGAATAAPGRIDADVTLAPTYSDAGTYTVRVAVTDGTHFRDFPFTVTVRDVNRPLVMTALPDTSVEIGSVLDLTVGAMDPDGPVTIALVEAPPFATLAGPYRLEFRPGLSDAGTYTVRFSGTCGQEVVTESFQLAVTDSVPHGPPTFDPLADVTCNEGDSFEYDVHARSTDGTAVTLSVIQAPRYVLFATDSYGADAWGRLWFRPGARDSGTALVRLQASTTLYRASAEFTVHIRAVYFPPVLRPDEICVEPGEGYFQALSVEAPELDTIQVSTGPLPSWMTFGYRFSGIPGVWLSTGPEDPPTTVQIDVYLNRGTPSEQKWTLPASIVGYDQCPRYGGGFMGSPPMPNAGGPYVGVAGAPVQFHATSTETVPNSAYRWTFGDGHAALGATVAHAYAEGGTYPAMIRLGQDPVSRDTASVVIADAYPATATPERDHEPLQLSRKADYAVLMERVGEAYDLTAIDPASLCLRVVRAGRADSVFASNTKGLELAMGDAGIQRLRITFSASDLDRLFTGMRGRLTVEGRVQARLVNGARVRAPITLTVVGRAGERGRIAVWPNPLNPAGTISFETERAGRVLVQVYAVSGRLVRTLYDGVREAGPVDVPFDGRNGHGETLASGVYYYRIESPGSVRSGRLTVLK